MAEIFGVVAGFCNICQVVGEALRQASDLYRAPIEIQKLETQVNTLLDVLQAVRVEAGLPDGPTLRNTLSRVQTIVEELHRLVKTKLLIGRDGASRARRLAWIKKRRTIVSLHEDLQEAMGVLISLLSSNILASTRRVEDIVGSTQTVTLRIDRTLNNILMVQTPQRTSLSTAVGIDACPADKKELCDPAPTWATRSSDGIFGHILEHTTSRESKNLITCPEGHNKSLKRISRSGEAPVSSFEKLPSFRPEAYTVLDDVPVLVSYRNQEVQATEYLRTNECLIIFKQAPGNWIRLTATIVTSAESKYWNTQRFRPPKEFYTPRDGLPSSLALMLGRILRARERITQDSHLSFYLGSESVHDNSSAVPQFRLKVTKAPFNIQAYLIDITNRFRHVQCQRIEERELNQQPLHPQYPNYVFLAWYHGECHLYFRFSSSKVQIDTQLYTLQVLHCLQGLPRINPLIGIVLDHENVMSGYLCKLPANGGMLQLMQRLKDSGVIISWERREKWCRQVIEAIAGLHNHGFVSGQLGRAVDFAIGIDADDNVVLYNSFRLTIDRNYQDPTFVPPEDYSPVALSGTFRVQPSTDIYQLAQLIYSVSTNNPDHITRQQFCQLAGCKQSPISNCTDFHHDLVQIVPAESSLPDYMKRLIAACRTILVRERPPAWKLLEMFPPAVEQQPILLKTSLTQKLSLEGYIKACQQKVFCGICGKITTGHHYHGNTCFHGDYDICQTCIAGGAHCLDREHYLQEYQNMVPKDFITCEKENGEREFLTI